MIRAKRVRLALGLGIRAAKRAIKCRHSNSTDEFHRRMTLPVCYTFRRCPYAIRARMAILAAGISVEYREIVFRNKPRHMLEASPKATVPVLILEDGTVIDESWDIMMWALGENDPLNWLVKSETEMEEINHLIETNDNEFKDNLDRYKYADRYPENTPEEYRERAEIFLQNLEERLRDSEQLTGNQTSIADIGIFPFIRQFANVDINWFNSSPYPKLQKWLNRRLDSVEFSSVMTKIPLWDSGSD